MYYHNATCLTLYLLRQIIQMSVVRVEVLSEKVKHRESQTERSGLWMITLGVRVKERDGKEQRANAGIHGRQWTLHSKHKVCCDEVSQHNLGSSV